MCFTHQQWRSIWQKVNLKGPKKRRWNFVGVEMGWTAATILVVAFGLQLIGLGLVDGAVSTCSTFPQILWNETRFWVWLFRDNISEICCVRFGFVNLGARNDCNWSTLRTWICGSLQELGTVSKWPKLAKSSWLWAECCRVCKLKQVKCKKNKLQENFVNWSLAKKKFPFPDVLLTKAHAWNNSAHLGRPLSILFSKWGPRVGLLTHMLLQLPICQTAEMPWCPRALSKKKDETVNW